VTLNGAPVTGEVTFIGQGKEAKGAAAFDGSYFINDPPLGEVKVTVKPIAIPGGALPKGKPADASKLPDMPAIGEAIKQGVPPPAKYASPDNGLKFEVKAGKQKIDISLTP
jgi:hypothetical protein